MAEPLNIPDTFKGGFAELHGLEPAAYAALLAALESEVPVLFPRRLAERVSARAGLGLDAVDLILVSVLSVHSLAEVLDKTPEGLAEDISESSDLGLTPDGAKVLAERLKALIVLRAVAVTSKALRVVTAHERPLHEVLLLSDIRPVFLSDPTRRPPAAAIVHTLALTTHSGMGGIERIDIALDNEDLGKLKRAVARAEDKARTLRALCEDSGMLVLDPS